MYNIYNTNNCNNSHNIYIYIIPGPAVTLRPSGSQRTTRVPLPFEMSTSSGELNPRANVSHCLYLEIGSIQVLIAMCKTAMTHTQFPCVSVTLLLVSHDATNEQTSPASVPIGPRDFNSVAGALCPSVKKFNPTGVVQPNLSSRCRIKP